MWTAPAWQFLVGGGVLVLLAGLRSKAFRTNATRKVWLWARGIFLFVTWREKRSFKKFQRPVAADFEEAGGVVGNTRTVIFIRHGESDWNEIFNKQKALLLPRLILGCAREARCFGHDDSVFIDSPLSAEGVDQATKLRRFLYEGGSGGMNAGDAHVQQMLATLRGAPTDANGAPLSVIASSNLRRAINTGCLGLWPRLKRTGEKVRLLSSLQEISRNVDTNAIARPHGRPEMAVVEREIGGEGFRAGAVLDASENTGNKKPMCDALPRFSDFCGWCFKQDAPTVIVGAGHSLWFKSFFDLYLPKASRHAAKKQKMLNCGVVGFTLRQAPGAGFGSKVKAGYIVEEASIKEVYLGFKKKKAKCGPKQAKSLLAGLGTVAVFVAGWLLLGGGIESVVFWS